MKKIVSLVILLALCVSILPLNAFAYEPFITVRLNSGVKQLYLNSQWLDRALVVYGTPQDVYDYDASPAQSYDDATGEWRYLGFTEQGFPFTNTSYPPDAISDLSRLDRDFVEFPWNEPEIACPQNEVPISEYQWSFIRPQLEELGYPPALTDYKSLSIYWSVQFMPRGNSGALQASFREWHWYGDTPWYETWSILFPEGISIGSQLIVEPPEATVAVGETTDYKAYLDYAGDGRDQFDPEVTTDCVWSTVDTNIGTIDRSRGRALGKNVGQTGVTAKYTKDGYDLSGSAILIVTAVGPVTPPGGAGANDLIATNLELLDSNGNAVSGSVEVNKPYKVRATFSSTFKTSGYAKVRFYIKRESGWMDIRVTENVFVEAESTFQREWDWSGTTEEVILMSSIDRRWAGSAWEDEKFNGTEEEITYENNVFQKGAVGTETIDQPPATENYGYPLYYHPVKYIEEPIIEQQPVIGWKKAIFIKDDTEYRVRARLVFPDQVNQ